LDSCKAHNVTPSDLKGLWRGLQIGASEKSGEWDVNFMETSVIISFEESSLRGDVSYTGRAPDVLLSVHVVESSLSGIHPGDTLNMIYDFDGAAPEVRYLSLASGQPNQEAPKSFTDAKTGNFFDWTLWECQPLTGCVFRANKFVRSTPKVQTAQVQVNDPCSIEGTCTQCLAHKFCGWCSVAVVYKDGTPGTNCAGFGNASRNQFECHGVFRTDDCNDYLCVEPQGECVKVPLGGGNDKATCMTECKPVSPSPIIPSGSPAPYPSPSSSPSPSPAPTYLCELSNFTCYQTVPGMGTSLEICKQSCHKATTPSPVSPVSPVNPSSSPVIAKTYLCHTNNYTCERAEPGTGTSKEICLENCKRPPTPTQPSPKPIPIVGTLRGLQVDNKYYQGEFDLKIDATGQFTLTLNSSVVTTGSISLGEKLGTVVVETKSKKLVGYYTQSHGRDVTHTLISFGKDESDVPSGWDAPWIKGGADGNVWVWIQESK